MIRKTKFNRELVNTMYLKEYDQPRLAKAMGFKTSGPLSME